MKKILTLLVLIILVGVVAGTLVACSNATVQGQLENVWLSYEKYTYTLSYTDDNGEEQTGTYISETTEYDAGSSVEVGTTTLSSVARGFLVASTLECNDSYIETAVYFSLTSDSNFLIPEATYRKEMVADEVTFEVSGVYDSTTLIYQGTENGEAISGSFTLSSPYYDNNEFHQTLRGVGEQMGTSLSFSFQLALLANGEQSAITISAFYSSTESVETNLVDVNGKGITLDCYAIAISRTDTSFTSSGSNAQIQPQYLYFSSTEIMCAYDVETKQTNIYTDGTNAWGLTNVLVKIEEPFKYSDGSIGTITYLLTSIDIK